ncbi:MAG: tyrosine-type recombinase/integrase, partial [Acidobacteriota bacterium]
MRKVKHGRRWVWIGKYYEEGTSRTKVLGQCTEMTEGAALAKLQEFLRPLNETAGMRQGLPSNFEAYVSNVYLPQRRKKWKDSTDLTTTDRIRKHLLNAFGEFDLKDLSRDKLQRLLDQKTEAGLSRSMVSHLRWDLNAIFKMANDDNLVKGNPAGSLVTPKGAKSAEKRTMTKEQVLLALSVLDIRERIVFLLAVLVGLRPGEIFALRWSKVDERMVEIAQRVYRGLPDDPKSARGKRQAALPPDLASDIERWREICQDTSPNALVFPSEKGTFLSRDNFLRRNLQGNLESVGLGWVNFQILRRTQA